MFLPQLIYLFIGWFISRIIQQASDLLESVGLSVIKNLLEFSGNADPGK